MLRDRRTCETIAAIATAEGPAGIAVVRISGPESWAVARRLLGRRASRALKAGRFFHAPFIDPSSGAALDSGLVLAFRGPASFTGEDVVELQGHGGFWPARRLLEAAFAAGARPAGPGEFSRRAFVNGRMDLTAAEAVMDLVQARSERAAVAARAQLAGGLGRAVAACYDDLLGVCAAAEAQLDLEEGESPEWIRDEVMRQAAGVARALDRLLATSREGHLLRAGAMVVIAGCPNAGKSSLLNALLGKERAIVSVHAGTTRDTIEEAMVLDGIPLRVVDTAGLRDVASGVEREGIVRAQNALSYADLILCVIDSSRPLSTQETQLLLRATERNDAPWLGVLNKSDLPRVVTKEEMEGVLRRSGKMLCSEVVSLSLKTRDGMPDVLRAMVRLLGIDNQAPAHASVSGRHRAELMLAQEFLSSAQAQLEYGEERLVLATHEMRRASEALGRIIGKCYTEELLDRIFSRFCVGK